MDEHEDDIDEQLELLPLDHRPIIPARAGHDGEQVYASIWQATMEQAPQIDYLGDEHRPIDDVLEDIVRPITQRDAAILATAACWLGCNFGQCLIDRAAREREESRWQAAHAYLHAWTLENLRRRGINGGIRVVEYMLALPEQRRPERNIMDSGLRELPELSARDLEVIDSMMLWLATGFGQLYLRRCEAKLEGIRHEKRLLERADWLRAVAEGASHG
jgi:hypothetical protein